MKFPWKQKTDLLFIVIGFITLIGYGMGTEQPEMLCTHDKIAESNPYKVSLSSQHKGISKRQAATSAEYSSIRIHPVFVNVDSSARSYIQSSDGPLFNSIRTLADILMVRPVQGNLVIPPMCSEYTSGLNEGKCEAPLPSQDNYGCGPFGIIPTDYIGTREVCATSSEDECTEDGPDGPGIPDADYLLFVSAAYTEYCYGGTLAYASTCMLDVSGNDRPIAGYINICPSALESFGEQENIVYGIFMHEIIHALGFSRSLFSRYINENGTKYNPVRTQYGPYGKENVFTGPKTTELAKKYYACDDINGLLLENEGGSGTVSSHWEKRTLHHALMNGYASRDYMVLSPFTIALFEDSGWYKGNYTALEMLNQLPLQWGKGLGCSFLNQRCTNKTIYPYLCDRSIEKYACTYDHLSKGRCSRNWSGFDTCPVVLPTDYEDLCQNDTDDTDESLDEIERYGSRSICVDAARAQFTSCGTYISSPMPLCVPQVTYSENNSSQYILQLQNESYSCTDNHSLIINNDWIVSCPLTAVITSSSTPVSGRIPTPSPSTFIELNNSLYELAESYINATGIVAFGELTFLWYHQTVVYYVNSLVNNTVSVCHLFGSANSDPVEVTNDQTVRLQGGNIYSVRRDELIASAGFTDARNQSQDFSLVIMLDPQASHSFLYYAACVDFVGDYLQSLHSDDESFFAITALANNIVIRIAPSKTVMISDVSISYNQEHTMILNLGDTVIVSSSEDLTGSRVTANKAVSFYSGHYCTSNQDTNCSILSEQIPPYNSWGNSFILHTNISGLRGNMFKIIASDVGANVSMNCTTDGSNYEANSFSLVFRQHKVISFIHDYCIVDSDENILIIQFKDSDESLLDTFMTIIPALSHFQTKYVFETYSSFDNHVVMTVKNTNPNTDSLLLNNNPVTLEWESVEINEITYYYSILSLSVNSTYNRQTLEFSRNDIKFGAIIYGVSQRENNTDTFALPAGLALNVRENLPIQAPSLVQDALVTVVDEMVNVTWSPPALPSGIIHKYIVQRINSSGTFYYHVSAKQHHILLPYFNDALVFVSAVNLFGQSEFTQAKPNVPCFPSPCINNGTCVAVNATNQQLPCNCLGIYSGAFCENGDKLYPFGPLQGDESFKTTSYDGRSSLLILNENFFFYDVITSVIYINNDGIISLRRQLYARGPIPRNLTTLGSQYIIAPFWAKVDIREAGNVFYRQTSEPSLLARATREVQSAFPTSSNATIKNLLIATWDAVGYYYMHSDKVNTFQCVLATTEFESFTMFLYDDGGIEWTTGDYSGGVNGLGGDEALAGISAGDGVNVITIPGSLTPSIIDIDNTSNVGIPGVWMFKVGTVNVSIVLNDSPYMFVNGSNSSFHLVGSNITMLCSIKSTPFANSEFRWKCSTGCLGGVETGQKITVTAQQSGVIVCAYTADGIEYNSDPIQIHITDFIPRISLEPSQHIVGQQQAIVCTVISIPGVDLNNSLVFTWMVPDGVNINDERLKIMPTIINGNNHTSILQFDYLMESDVGTYKCNVTLNQSTSTLLVNLRDLLILRPRASIIAPAIQNFRQPLTLTCEVTTVRGITSAVIIIWRIPGNELRRVENASGSIIDSSMVYRDQLYISELMSEDYYFCRGIINSTREIFFSAYYRVQLTSPNAAPSSFRNISKTSTTIIFQWDALELTQSNNGITLYVITCSDLEEESIFTENVTGSITMGTVSDLRPFTYYNCSVYAVTKYGGPSSNAITVQTAEAVSSAPIITSVTAIDSYSLHVMWTVPTEPNGIITNYTITYYIGALNITINIPFNGEMTQSFNITGLSPYQLVAVTITAINGAGMSSPSDQVSNRTTELAPGVVEFHVNGLTASSEAEVTWSPPLQPNGVITSYQVIYSVYESSTIITSEMLSNTTNTYIIRNLVPGIPYQVTVVAFTIVGSGALNDYIVFFSEELMPERFPSNISYKRRNETTINVTWTPLSLSEAQGFPLYQVILSEPSTNSDTAVVTNSSFVIFANLSIDQQYSLVVGVSTGSDRSVFVYSDPIIVLRLTGCHSGAAVIEGTIGRIVLIAILVVIIF